MLIYHLIVTFIYAMLIYHLIVTFIYAMLIYHLIVTFIYAMLIYHLIILKSILITITMFTNILNKTLLKTIT